MVPPWPADCCHNESAATAVGGWLDQWEDLVAALPELGEDADLEHVARGVLRAEELLSVEGAEKERSRGDNETLLLLANTDNAGTFS